MINKIFTLVFFLNCFSSFAGSGVYKDTIVIKTAFDTIFDNEKRPIILFSDNTWVFEEDILSGIYYIDTLAPLSDTAKIFKELWLHSHIHNDTTDLTDMADEIKIPLTTVEHPTAFLPKNARVNYAFGFRRYEYHYGVDLKSNYGDTLRSCFDGKVRYAGYNGNYGNVVVVRHYNGLETIYAHMSKMNVNENQLIRAGHVVGYVGSTGRSTGPHLHFEVRYNGNAIDPERVFNFDNNTLVSDTLTLNNEVFAYKKEINRRVYHKIRSGDTLSGLAYKYGTSVNKICSLNGMSRNSTLRVGRTLRVR